MPYEKMATKKSPALVIYLLDMSGSMAQEVNGISRMDLVSQTMLHAFREMVHRSTKGTVPSPRYRVAAFAYNHDVKDIFGGARPITDIINIGVPVIDPSSITNTAGAFEAAEQLLINLYDEINNGPAPLICHLTDGHYNTDSPLPIAERIRRMPFADGAPLIENVFYDSTALRDPVTDPYTWPGVMSSDELAFDYARELYEMSSLIPPAYLKLFAERRYAMREGARMFFPGESPELVEAAFTMSAMTPIA